MSQENRQSERYQEIGKVTSAEICSLPGILDDISATGCKIHYAFPVTVDMETEYELRLSPLHNSDEAPLVLKCLPQWINQIDDNTYIGFKVLYSPDANRLNEFIIYLKDISKDQLPDIL